MQLTPQERIENSKSLNTDGVARTSHAVNIGLPEDLRREIAEQLSRFVADSFVLSIRTRHFHWNITGPNFHSLHQMLDEQHEELELAVDTLSERVRMLGFVPPATLSAYITLTSFVEQRGNPNANSMLSLLCEDHELLSRNIRRTLNGQITQSDFGTTDLLIRRLASHEKTAWMLRNQIY